MSAKRLRLVISIRSVGRNTHRNVCAFLWEAYADPGRSWQSASVSIYLCVAWPSLLRHLKCSQPSLLAPCNRIALFTQQWLSISWVSRIFISRISTPATVYRIFVSHFNTCIFVRHFFAILCRIKMRHKDAGVENVLHFNVPHFKRCQRNNCCQLKHHLMGRQIHVTLLWVYQLWHRYQHHHHW